MNPLFFLLCMTIFSFSSLSSEVRTCTSLKDYFGSMGFKEGDLVVCDIDGTLLLPQEPALDDRVIRTHMDTLIQLTEWTPLLKEVAGNLTVGFPMVLIEKEIPQVLADIQNRGIPVVALTACQMYPCGDQETPRFRFEQLQGLGINLSNPLHQEGMIEFDELERVLGYFPGYYRGMIVSNPWFFGPAKINEKGAVLQSFINSLSVRPKRVIFCDDRLMNLASVETALKEMGIAFEGCHYVGAGEFCQQQPVSVERFKAVWSELIDRAKIVLQDILSLRQKEERGIEIPESMRSP